MQSYREDMSINLIISHCGLTLIINCMICCHPKFVKLGIEKQTERNFIILTVRHNVLKIVQLSMELSCK